MKTMTWAFLFLMEGCHPQTHRCEIEACGDRLITCGVSSAEEGARLARELAEKEDCRLIEVCGGLGKEGARTILRAVEGRVPVGYVDYPPESREPLKKLEEYLSEG